MVSLVLSNALLPLLPSSSLGSAPCIPLLCRGILSTPRLAISRRTLRAGLTVASGRPSAMAKNGAFMTDSTSQSNGIHTVGDFMTKREDLHVVKPATSVGEALEMLVEHRITGLPVIDDDWTLTFNKIQKLLSKTNGKVIGDVMTPSPLVVRETTNLEDVARLLLETKYHRLPVVDSAGKLIGIITRGNVVRAALQIKHASEKNSQL
ncbi:CBS domain-containing protein CBSX1, chloroplastic-like isoform X2 [Phoenix dactylifera]|uniref:CBS domain-containing protein CBSX1, chloroplastic-like isoform X2 n=1 Tax=Phoenix dactylifera TaxID=42345 RepID=A0A8B7MUS6_PHODC|nr:CBS domain-containing protein CBSX1, chloroplastic-like isoform X2 [Phoenix dactylifera]